MCRLLASLPNHGLRRRCRRSVETDYLDLGARILAEQPSVAGLDVDRDELATVAAPTGGPTAMTLPCCRFSWAEIKVARHKCARSACLRPSPELCCFQATKRFGTSFRNCRIGLFAAGHYCPAAFLDERPAIPSVADFVQLGEICGCVRRLAELVDADRSKTGNHA